MIGMPGNIQYDIRPNIGAKQVIIDAINTTSIAP
jgi:hypothetical protein